MTEKSPIADFTQIEWRGEYLKCSRCGQYRRVLLCVGGGQMICRECKNAAMRRLVDSPAEYVTK